VVKSYDFAPALFGGDFPLDGGVTAPLGVGSTGWGCTSQGHLDPLDGKIAILDRGGPNDAGCPFVEKARNAQDAGAIALWSRTTSRPRSSVLASRRPTMVATSSFR
jgi:hypothetical protein